MAVDHSMLWNEVKEGEVYPHNEKWYSHLLDQYKLYGNGRPDQPAPYDGQFLLP